jgi:hypothetical protein
MVMPTRRKILQLSCACAASSVISFATSDAQTSRSARGCILTPRGFQAYRAKGYGLATAGDIFTRGVAQRSTGKAELDRQLSQAVKVAAATLEINPAFGFYEPEKFTHAEIEFPSMNAFTWPSDVADVPGTRGVVGIGLTKLRTELYGYDETGTTVMAIVAHEFGHVLQREYGYIEKIPDLARENNADFLSGYYLGTRKRRLSSMRIETALDFFKRSGRGDDGNPKRDHGDSRERPAAALAGYQVGLAGKDINEAVRTGLTYIGYGHLAR